MSHDNAPFFGNWSICAWRAASSRTAGRYAEPLNGSTSPSPPPPAGRGATLTGTSRHGRPQLTTPPQPQPDSRAHGATHHQSPPGAPPGTPLVSRICTGSTCPRCTTCSAVTSCSSAGWTVPPVASSVGWNRPRLAIWCTWTSRNSKRSPPVAAGASSVEPGGNHNSRADKSSGRPRDKWSDPLRGHHFPARRS